MESSLPLAYIEGWDAPALARYQVLKRLATESTGTVYLVVDKVQEQHVRLKVMRPPPVAQAPALRRNDGVSLRSMLQSGQRLPAERVVRIGGGLCRALAGAHGVGVPHPRLRPESVFVRANDEVSIADFVNRKLEPVPLASLAPELRKGRPPTLQSDIYAVGAILYECLTGRLPAEIPVPPSAYGMCTPALDSVIMRALDPDPAERFVSIGALETALSGDVVSAEDITLTGFAGKPDDDAEEQLHDLPTMIFVNATRRIVARVRRFPRLLLCATLLALLLEGTVAPACSGWSAEAVRAASTIEFSYSPAWPLAH